jgi:GT2 family glycosyltransferase
MRNRERQDAQWQRNNLHCKLRARSEILAYLDDDMLPQQNWLGALVESFADKSVMAVPGPVLPLQLFGSSEAELQNALDLVPLGRRSFSIERSDAQWFERANFGGIGDGNFALRRSAFSQLRGFNERLGRGMAIDAGEEHYAFFRIIDLGGKVTYAPQAIVFHPNSARSDKLDRKLLRENAAYFCFLMFRHPFRILLVLKFAIEGFFGKRRWWCIFPKSREDQVPKWQKLSSGYKGFVDFLQSLVQMS